MTTGSVNKRLPKQTCKWGTQTHHTREGMEPPLTTSRESAQWNGLGVVGNATTVRRRKMPKRRQRAQGGGVLTNKHRPMSTRNTKAIIRVSQRKPSQRPKRKTTLQRSAQQSRVMVAPVAVTKVYTAPKPTVRTKPSGTILFKHTEYIADLAGSLLFSANRKIAINPGNDQFFPYLSSIAANFEYYKFKKLVVRFETTAPTTQTGTVMMYIDYDATDGYSPLKRDFMANQNATRTAPWAACRMDLVKAANEAQVRRFVLSSPPAFNQDPKLYNLGNLWIGTDGQIADGTRLGELYVDYEVELSVPQAQSGEDESATIQLAPGATPTDPLAGATILQNERAKILSIPGLTEPPIGPATTMRLLKPGKYTIDHYLNSTGTTATGVNLFGPTNVADSGVLASIEPSSSMYSFCSGHETLCHNLLSFAETVAPNISTGLFTYNWDAALVTNAALGSIVRIARRSLPEQFKVETI